MFTALFDLLINIAADELGDGCSVVVQALLTKNGLTFREICEKVKVITGLPSSSTLCNLEWDPRQVVQDSLLCLIQHNVAYCSKEGNFLHFYISSEELLWRLRHPLYCRLISLGYIYPPLFESFNVEKEKGQRTLMRKHLAMTVAGLGRYRRKTILNLNCRHTSADSESKTSILYHVQSISNLRYLLMRRLAFSGY